MAQSDTSSQEVLRDEILADARRQAERAIRKAERDGQAAMEKAKSEAEQEREEKLATAHAAAERKRSLALASVPVEIGRMRAADVEQALRSLRERARQQLADRQGFDYGPTLALLAAEAIARMDGDAFVLGLSAADHSDYSKTLAAEVQARIERPGVSVTVDPQPADIAAGIVVRDPEGRQVWDNSLAARLDRLWPSLRSQLAEYLGLQAGAEPSGVQS